MYRKIFAISIIAVSSFCLNPAFADDAKIPRTMSLNGRGEVRLAPDMAIVNIGTMSTAATAREAHDANTKAMAAIFAALTAAQIDKRDIQTSNFNVNPRYDYGPSGTQPPKVLGYDVSNGVTVTVHKLDNLGAVLDSVVSSGANQINGITFQVAEPDAAMDEARKLAVADARRKANVYAGAANTTLGDMLSISEGGGYQPPIPMFKSARTEAMSADVPIAQGEQVIAIDVNITWEIK